MMKVVFETGIYVEVHNAKHCQHLEDGSIWLEEKKGGRWLATVCDGGHCVIFSDMSHCRVRYPKRSL